MSVKRASRTFDRPTFHMYKKATYRPSDDKRDYEDSSVGKRLWEISESQPGQE